MPFINSDPATGLIPFTGKTIIENVNFCKYFSDSIICWKYLIDNRLSENSIGTLHVGYERVSQNPIYIAKHLGNSKYEVDFWNDGDESTIYDIRSLIKYLQSKHKKNN